MDKQKMLEKLKYIEHNWRSIKEIDTVYETRGYEYGKSPKRMMILQMILNLEDVISEIVE